VNRCKPSAGEAGVPRWARNRQAGLWAVVVWLLPLMSEPAAHATEADPQWPVWILLAVVAGSFTGTAVLGSFDVLPAWTGPRRTALAAALLAVQTVASVAVVAGSPESSLLFPMLAIAGVVALDARRGLWWMAGAAVLASVTIAAAGGTGDQNASAVLVTVLSGLGSWSFRRLFAVIGELARTRDELARVAVARERERFSRDLHDLLGHTLSVIVVKAQAVRRLAELDPATAAGQAGDIETIGRRALTEVRQAVEGYAGTGLAAELERARAALGAAGVAVTVAEPADGETLPADVDALFGWVVREGVTNVIRHAGAATCRITWSLEESVARLSLADDGRGAGAASGTGAEGAPPGAEDSAPGVPGGHGLAGLRDRVAAAGGSLAAAAAADGGFRLEVEVPAGVREAARS
jgi:two-component system sensor histidine kinase DesK